MIDELKTETNKNEIFAQKVRIKPTETGAFICTYKNNPAYGYVHLASEELKADGEVLANSFRSCLLRAKIQILEKFCAVYSNQDLPGRIVVNEFLESELREQYKARLNKNLAYEDAIAPYVKRAGKDGIELTLGGERILRFTDYDASGKVLDVFVKSDNYEKIVALSSQKSKEHMSTIRPITHEVVNPVSKTTTISTENKQPISSPFNADKTKQRIEENNSPKEHSSSGKSFGYIFIPLVIIAYVGYIIIENDRIARTEGSSLWDQLMLLLAAIGIYAIYKTFKKK